VRSDRAAIAGDEHFVEENAGIVVRV
jgi:hypothetical protein